MLCIGVMFQSRASYPRVSRAPRRGSDTVAFHHLTLARFLQTQNQIQLLARNLSHTHSHAPEHMHKLAVTEIAGLCLWVIAAPWVKIKGFSDRRVAHPLAGRRRETERGLWKSYF